jgi:hypothetical protein
MIQEMINFDNFRIINFKKERIKKIKNIIFFF